MAIEGRGLFGGFDSLRYYLLSGISNLSTAIQLDGLDLHDTHLGYNYRL